MHFFDNLPGGKKDENEKHKNEPVRSDGHIAFSTRFGIFPDKWPSQSGRSHHKNWRGRSRAKDHQHHAQ
jgi:hypothetical protein